MMQVLRALVITVTLLVSSGSALDVVIRVDDVIHHSPDPYEHTSSKFAACWQSREKKGGKCRANNCNHKLYPAWKDKDMNIVYPLTEQMFVRSVPYEAQTLRLQRALAKAEKGDGLVIAVIGGSMTFGMECEELLASGVKITGVACSWQRRVENWLKARFPKSDIEVRSYANGACSTPCHVHEVAYWLPHTAADVDLVIVDTGVNDLVHPLADEWHEPYSPGDNEDILIWTEVLVRYLLSMAGEPAVVYLEGMTPVWKERSMDVAEYHRNVTEAYGIPFVSYRHGVWPTQASLTNPALEQLWHPKGTPHPSAPTHQLFADVFTHYLEDLYLKMCDEGFSSDTISRDLTQPEPPALTADGPPQSASVTDIWETLGLPALPNFFQLNINGSGVDSAVPHSLAPTSLILGKQCSMQGTRMTSNGCVSSSKQNALAGLGWILRGFHPKYPDVLGYVAENSPGAKITFNVDCGMGLAPNATLTLKFMKSFEHHGRISVKIRDAQPKTLDSLWKRPWSVKTTIDFTVPRTEEPFDVVLESLAPMKNDQPEKRQGHRFILLSISCN